MAIHRATAPPRPMPWDKGQTTSFVECDTLEDLRDWARGEHPHEPVILHITDLLMILDRIMATPRKELT